MTESSHPTQTAVRAVVHDEDLVAFAAALPDFLAEQKKLLRGASKPGRLYQSGPNKPDIGKLVEDELLTRLRDEVVPAVETTDDSIGAEQVNEEVIKRALIGLKLEGMRRVARSKNLKLGGSAEELATRIARSLQWSGREVAELILQNTPPDEERSYVDRFYPLDAATTLDEVGEQVEYVLGRYIRVGVARWFVFEGVERDDLGVHVTGTFRAWDPHVNENGEELDVVAVERRKTIHRVRVTIDHSPILRVNGGNLVEARAAVAALTAVTSVGPIARLQPKTAGIDSGAAVTFAPESLFLLDLLQSRFQARDLVTQNLTVARFRMAPSSSESTSGWRRPALRAVRFEGSYLLDNPPACKLLANEGRALVDVSLTMRSATSAPGIETSAFPVRIALDQDHVLVLTGFGSTPSHAFAAHEQIRRAVVDEMTSGLLDPSGVALLADRIEERARAATPSDTAEILVDPDDVLGDLDRGSGTDH